MMQPTQLAQKEEHTPLMSDIQGIPPEFLPSDFYSKLSRAMAPWIYPGLDLGAHRPPMEDYRARFFAALWEIFVQAHSRFVLGWSGVFLALFVHDLVAYRLFPEDRYGASLMDIVLGRENLPAQMNLSVNLGADEVSEPEFFLGLGVVLSTWILFNSYGLARHAPWINLPDRVSRSMTPAEAISRLLDDQPNSQETLEALSKIILDTKDPGFLAQLVRHLSPVLMRRATVRNKATYFKIAQDALALLTSLPGSRADFYRWSLGIKTSKSWADVRYWLAIPIALLTVYAQVRLLEILVQKATKSWQFDLHECACHALNQAWKELQVVNQYLCKPCGDWAFMSYRNASDPQSCIQGLMSESMNPEEMIIGLTRFSNGVDLRRVDFSDLHWTAWGFASASQIFQALLNAGNGTLSELVLSDIQPGFSVPNDLLMPLQTLLAKLPLKVLSFRQLPLLVAELRSLFSEIQLPVQSLSLQEMYLGDDLIEVFLNEPQVLSEVQVLNLASNNLTDLFLGPLAKLSWSNIRELDLSDNVFEIVAYPVIAQLFKSTLEVLNLAHNQIKNEDVLSMLSGLNNRLLQHLGLAENDISSGVMASLMAALQNSSLQGLDLSGNPLGDAGFKALALGLNQTRLNTLQLSHIGLTGLGLQQAPMSFLSDLNLSNNVLGDAGLQALAAQFLSGQFSVKKLSLSAVSASSTGWVALLEALPDSVQVLDFSNNQFDQDVVDALMNFLRRSTQLSSLNLANTNLSGADITALAQILPQSALTALILDHNPLGGQAAVFLAQALLKPGLPNLNHLGDPRISPDEARHWSSQARANTMLNYLSLQASNISEAGARALCRVNQFLQPLQDVILDGNELLEVSLINCAFQAINASGGGAHHPRIASILPISQQCEHTQDIRLLVGIFLGALAALSLGILALYLGLKPRARPTSLASVLLLRHEDQTEPDPINEDDEREMGPLV